MACLSELAAFHPSTIRQGATLNQLPDGNFFFFLLRWCWCYVLSPGFFNHRLHGSKDCNTSPLRAKGGSSEGGSEP